MPEVLGQSADGRHKAPGEHRKADEVAPIVAVSPHGHWHTERGVEDCKHQTGEQAQLGVRDQQRLFDRLAQYAHNLAVNMA